MDEKTWKREMQTGPTPVRLSDEQQLNLVKALMLDDMPVTAVQLSEHFAAVRAELAAKDAALAEARGILLRVCNKSRPHGMVDGNPHLLPHEVMVEARLFVANSPNRPTLEKHQ